MYRTEEKTNDVKSPDHDDVKFEFKFDTEMIDIRPQTPEPKIEDFDVQFSTQLMQPEINEMPGCSKTITYSYGCGLINTY